MKMVEKGNLKAPSEYVRRKGLVDEKVADYRLVLKTAIEDDPKKPRWPFPALVVRHLKGDDYEVIDGMHRRAAAMAAKWEGEIPCDVRTDLGDDRHALLAQVAENLKHGIGLSATDRDAIIVKMRDGENPVPLKDIADRLKMTESWVSRIAAGKGRKGKSRKGVGGHGKKKKGESAGRAESAPDVFTPVEFFAGLDSAADWFNANRQAVMAFKPSVDPAVIVRAFNMVNDLTA